ncbi:MAG: LacI family DNA-binding transcriptional regulator [Lentisphaeria bacterium]|nr:LacI family DNA-binding transcriptional regulator [Lentisphaeria bacterium]
MSKMDKTEAIRTFVLDFAAHRKLNPGERIPSIRELADMTGSSLLTVHRAVSAMVTEGILQARRGSGFYIAPASQVKSNIIGIFFSCRAEENSFVSEVLQKLHDAIAAAGFLPVFLYCSEESPLKLENLNLGGAVIYNSRRFADEISVHLKKLNIPMVCINDIPARLDMPRISTDNTALGEMVANCFIRNGHRNFMILPPPGNAATVQERIRGFRLALAENELSTEYCTVFNEEKQNVDFDDPEYQKQYIAQAAEFLKMHREITAVFAIHDVLALMLVQKLSVCGLRVPEDISVIGCDNQSFCATMEPALTTVAQPLTAIAAETAQTLLANPTDVCGKTVTFKPELIERSSVKKLN